MDSKFDFDAVKVKNRLDNQTKRAQKILKNEIAKDSEKFVPLRSSFLRKSIMQSLQSNDSYLIYNSPYARFLYYGYVMIGKVTKRAWARYNETKIKTNKKLTYSQPLACPFWFERAKSLYKSKWVKIAKKVYK